MKNIIYLILFTFILCTPTVFSQTIIAEWSANNVTWNEFQDVDSIDHVACQPYLDQNTQYNTRLRNSTASFGYLQLRTLFGGLNEKMIQIALILIVAIVMFMFFGVMLEGPGTRLFFFMIAFIELLVLLWTTLSEVFDANVMLLMRINFSGLFLIIGGMGLYAIIKFFMDKAVPMDDDKEELKWKGN